MAFTRNTYLGVITVLNWIVIGSTPERKLFERNLVCFETDLSPISFSFIYMTLKAKAIVYLFRIHNFEF